jgi:hypothetical protein
MLNKNFGFQAKVVGSRGNGGGGTVYSHGKKELD